MIRNIRPIMVLIFALLICVRWTNGDSCTVIAVGKKASTDGSVIISHTDCGFDSRIFVVPGRTYKPGEKAPVYWGIQDVNRPLLDDGEVIGYIPQAARTYTYFHSAYPHINEFQLAIAESTLSQRDELVVNRENGKQIMTVEQAMVFALQRCKKAREAVQLIGDLMTTYGFLPSSGNGSEALVIADPEEGWIFEVFSVGPGWTPESHKPGAVWAAQRLPEDEATIIPNWSIIKEIHKEDPLNFITSPNYMQEAVDRGWYDPEGGRPFIWQEVYSPLPREWATGRFWLFYTTVAPHSANWPDRNLNNDPYKGLNQYYQYVEPLSLYPFSVRPEKKISVQDVMALQRSTFEGTIYDLTSGPEWLVPDGKGGFKKSPLATPFPSSDLKILLKLTNRRPVARRMGQYGMICQLRSWLPDAIGGVYWVYLDNPYFSPYVPIYAGNLSVAEPYNIYDPENYDEKSARWAIDFVDNLANLKFQEAVKDVWAVRNPFEEEIFQKQSQVEGDALQLYQQEPRKAREYLTQYSNSLMNRVLEIYHTLRNTLISKYTNNKS
ncbi:MAG: C69 family dipeptidase [Candidatus Aminicenantales bacterium]